MKNKKIKRPDHRFDVGAEASMQVELALLSRLLPLIPGYSYWKNKEGVIEGCNQQFTHLVGASSITAVYGKRETDMPWASQADVLEASHQRVLSKSIAETTAIKFKPKDDEIKNYLIKSVPVLDDGLPCGVLNILFDVSFENPVLAKDDEYTRMHAQISRLEKTNNMLKTVIDNIPGSIYWKNKEGVYQGNNGHAKENMSSIGFEETDPTGKTDYDLFIKEIADEFRKNDFEVMSTGSELTKEEKYEDEDGRKLCRLSTKKPIYDGHGDVIGVVGNTVDITAVKEAEALKGEKLAAEKRQQTLELLAASVAHELRTPLATIKVGAKALGNDLEILFEAYANVDKKKLGKTIPNSRLAGIRKMLPNINTAVRNANNIIDLLVSKSGLSAIDTRKFKKCSVADCVHAALDQYPLNDEQRSLIHWQPGDFSFQGDEALFKHVIFNLLKNSLYYVKAASKGDIQIWTEEGSEYNALHFKDTGQGIPKDVLPHIFEHSFTTLSHGTGVGLAFSNMVMQAMDGKIICSSELGKYTEFIMYFPKIA